MGDLISAVSTSITLLTRLKEISNHIKDAEFNNLLADLSLELADVKLKLSNVTDENIALRNKVRELENTEGEPCPKCRKRGWQLESSKPDAIFGDLGGNRHAYKCIFCNFSEEKIVT